MFYTIWALLYLTQCTITDIREKKIYTKISLINIFVAISVHVIKNDMYWMHIVAGMILWTILLAISIVSKGAIGKGDGLIIFTVGCIAGIMNSISVIIIGFVACFIVGMILILVKEVSIKYTLPFAPFLLVGEIITIII